MKTSVLSDINSRIQYINDERKRKLINSIIKEDNWYLKISLDTFVSILLDLGYKKEEAIFIFKTLNMPE